MSGDPVDLKAEVAALRAMCEEQFKGLNARMGKVERTQKDLHTIAIQGKTGLRMLLWIGGALAGGVGLFLSFWRQP